MAFYGKEYQLVNNDDRFPAFVKSLGYPAELEEAYINSKPVVKTVKNGDSYTQTVTIGEKVYTTTFKAGVQFDETFGELKLKSTFFVDGNTITHVDVNVKDGKKATTKSEFTDTDLKETVSGDNFDGVAVRYFKAI